MTQLPSADEVAGAFREVLSGPEFATLTDTLGQRILMWLLNQWTRALQWMRDLIGDGGPGLLTTIVVAAALVAIVAMVLVARRHAHRLKVSGEAGDDDLAPAARGMADWLALATGRAGRGRWRPAATALYQGLLLKLDQDGVLSFHDSKTPGDYLWELSRASRGRTAARKASPAEPNGAPGVSVPAAGRAASQAVAAAFLRSFEDYSFGQGEATPSGYETLARLAHEAGCPLALAASQSGRANP